MRRRQHRATQGSGGAGRSKRDWRARGSAGELGFNRDPNSPAVCSECWFVTLAGA